MMNRINGFVPCSISGSGASSVANLICSHIEGKKISYFRESDAASSCTLEPSSKYYKEKKLIVFDFAGLDDSNGRDEKINEENIAYLNNVNNIDGLELNLVFLIILNEKKARLSNGTRLALKMFYDTYGVDMIKNLCIVFTHATNTSEVHKKAVVEIKFELSKLFKIEIRELPAWQVDCYPEKLSMMGASQDFIDQMKVKTFQSVDGLISWARTTPRFNPSKAKAAEYERKKILREAETERENQKRIAQSRPSVIYSNQRNDNHNDYNNNDYNNDNHNDILNFIAMLC